MSFIFALNSSLLSHLASHRRPVSLRAILCSYSSRKNRAVRRRPCSRSIASFARWRPGPGWERISRQSSRSGCNGSGCTQSIVHAYPGACRSSLAFHQFLAPWTP